MVASKVTVTPEELYEMVWSTPMQKLAAQLGFSDVGFAKLCRQHKIPVPPRGYWARFQVGRSVKRTPLPPAIQTTSGAVEIYAHERQPGISRADTEAHEIPTIDVAEDRPLSHPITLCIEKSLSTSQRNDRGLLIPKFPMTVPVLVSAQRLPRALRIPDVLLEVLEQAEYPLTWPTAALRYPRRLSLATGPSEVPPESRRKGFAASAHRSDPLPPPIIFLRLGLYPVVW